MPHPHKPSQATATPPDGDVPVITNDLYTPMTLEEDPPGAAPSSEDHPAPGTPGHPEDGEPAPPAKPAGSEEEPPASGSRFKSLTEAENGYRHIQSHASRLEQENKTLRETLENRSKEEAAAREKAARDTQFRKYAATRRAQLMKDVGELDPDDPNHNDQLGSLYAEADADIWNFQQNPPPLETPAAGDETMPKAGDASSEATLPPATPTLEEQEAAYQTVASAAATAGVPLDDPTFQGFSAKAPTADANGHPIPLEQQAKWAIDQTRDAWLKFLADEAKLNPDDPALQHFVNKAPTAGPDGKPLPLADRLREAIKNTQTYHATQRSQAVQEVGAPLSSGARFGVPPGGSPPGAPGNRPPEPTTLSAAIAAANEHRRL